MNLALQIPRTNRRPLALSRACIQSEGCAALVWGDLHRAGGERWLVTVFVRCISLPGGTGEPQAVSQQNRTGVDSVSGRAEYVHTVHSAYIRIVASILC